LPRKKSTENSSSEEEEDPDNSINSSEEDDEHQHYDVNIAVSDVEAVVSPVKKTAKSKNQSVGDIHSQGASRSLTMSTRQGGRHSSK